MLRLLLLPFKLAAKLVLRFFRFMVNLVFSLLMTLAILALTFYLLNSSFLANSNVTTAFNQGLSGISNYVNQIFDMEAEGLPQGTDLATDQVQTANHGTRWDEPAATVYIASTNSTLVSAYQEAIANWNATGVFTFTLVDQAEGANIIATDYSDDQTEAAGLAESTANSLTERFLSVTVKLNTHYLLDDRYGYTYDRIVHTAEHELGHAIGLDHEDATASVMESSGSNTGIQAHDIAEVRELYAA